MKKLISIIVILGTVIVAVRAVHREQPTELAKDVPPIDSPAAPRGVDSGLSPAQHSSWEHVLEAEARPVEKPPTVINQMAASPQEGAVPREPAVPPDWNAPCPCAAAWHRRIREREEAARKAEPKDIAWAYETEQLLAQSIAAHPQAKTMQVSNIECRTSFCEIKASGQPDAWEEFSAVIEQARHEAWSTFSGDTDLMSTSGEGGRRHYRAIIEREPMTVERGGPPASPEPALEGEECWCATPEWHDT